jgi:hypothetical protein
MSESEEGPNTDNCRLTWMKVSHQKVRQVPHRCHVDATLDGTRDEVPHGNRIDVDNEKPDNFGRP